MRHAPDDFIGAETILSDVDGEAGRLVIRGHDLESLAGRRTYEEVVAILWRGVVGDATDVAPDLGAERVRAFERLAPRVAALAGDGPVATMQALLSVATDGGPVAALAASAVAASLATRVAAGAPPLAPDRDAGHAADLLRMLRGTEPSAIEARTLDTYLVSAIDHGLNASTYTARVVASTRAGLAAAITAAFAALSGPLHGGAPGPVLDMLDAVGAPARAASWVAAELAAGRRLMGFGHRIYRVRDPRADVLKAALAALAPSGPRLALAEAVERAALQALRARHPARPLDTNTEFYTALLLESLRIPRAAFTPVFAAARTAGWIAHAREQEADGRLIRPRSRYLGERPARAA